MEYIVYSEEEREKRAKNSGSGTRRQNSIYYVVYSINFVKGTLPDKV